MADKERETQSEGRRDRDISLIVIGAALALVTSLATQCYQDTARRRERVADLLHQDQREAVTALLEVTQRVNDAYQPAGLFAAAERARLPVDSLRKLQRQFRVALAEWTRNLNRSRLIIAVYLGEKADSQLVYVNGRLSEVDTILTNLIGYRLWRRTPNWVMPDYLRDTTKLSPPVLTALHQKLAADSSLHRHEAEIAGINVELRRLHLQRIDDLNETLFLFPRSWAYLIQGRRTGSFDPLAAPSEELGRVFVRPLQ